MNAIKDILKLDLNEDIKNVIDLEDRSQDEIPMVWDNTFQLLLVSIWET
jgi:hypothetical protein